MQQPEERPDDRSTDRPEDDRDGRDDRDRPDVAESAPDSDPAGDDRGAVTTPEPTPEPHPDAEQDAEQEQGTERGAKPTLTTDAAAERPGGDQAGTDRPSTTELESDTESPDSTDTPDAPDAPDGSNSPDDTDDPDSTDDSDSPDGTDSPAGTPRPRGPRAVLTTAATVVGELLITAGIVLGLFVAYSLWWTNIVANQEAQRDSDAVRDAWDQQVPEDDDQEAREYDADAEDGVGFLHVPAMSGDEILVKEGVDLDILNGGVAGLYDDPVESAMPWDDEGNVSLAAHRDGHGAKFHRIDRLDDGDAIVFETKDTWYVYRVYATLPETSPRNTAVLDPVPEQSGVAEAGQYLTLTTCTPVYSSAYRYIVWGELERTEEVDEQRTPPPELSED